VKTCFHKKCGVFEACKKVKDFFDTLEACRGKLLFYRYGVPSGGTYSFFSISLKPGSAAVVSSVSRT